MPKYRLLCYHWGGTRRVSWAIVSAKNAQDAIDKGKASEKAIHDKYNPRKKFKSACTGWIAKKVSSNTKVTRLTLK